MGVRLTSQTENTETSSQQTKRRHTKTVLGIVCLCIIAFGLIWGKSSWIQFCQWQAERSLLDRKVDLALSWGLRAYQTDSQNADTLLILARAHRRAREIDNSIEYLKKLHQITGPSEDLKREQWLVEAQVGDINNLEQNLADLLIDPKGNAQDICETFVNSCILNYRFPEALKVLELWQADFPDDPLPHYYRGRILEHKGSWDGAEKEFISALKIAPDNVPAAYNLARVKLSQNQVDQALENYRICTQNQKGHTAALVGIARCLRMKQNIDGARLILQEAQGIPEKQRLKDFRDVGDPAHVARNAVLLELGQLELSSGNYEKAATYLEKSLELNSKDRKSRLALANAYRGLGDLEKAEQQIQIVETTQKAIKRMDECFDLLQKDSKNADLRAEIGQIFLEHISENQGIVWLKNALYYDPKHQQAKQALEKYYAEQGSEPNR
ncbi:tetratricopeptide repeat protein [Gimesia aquarii]|uniref:Tetratricopeptide repeat protein n=1 Tax=Gimesia aquarii TaxID=2527964 RepID=A0A517VTN6_9PLAN|nr:tetratricopeptide repeat protein [Gimesia aquarii]QDT96368.1 tetratricopeptide repeat protein [Gimesia aquarii]